MHVIVGSLPVLNSLRDFCTARVLAASSAGVVRRADILREILYCCYLLSDGR